MIGQLQDSKTRWHDSVLRKKGAGGDSGGWGGGGGGGGGVVGKGEGTFEPKLSLRVSPGADIDFPALALGLHPIGQRDIVAKETVARHLSAHHSGQHLPCVDTNAHLPRKKCCGY